jgi:hypothetical protein
MTVPAYRSTAEYANVGRQTHPQVGMLWSIMETWYRVFAHNDFPVDSPALLEWFRARQSDATGHFRGDELGWFEARLQIPGFDTPLLVERFLTKEDVIRGELNTWAAWLESTGESPEHQCLMQLVISTKQLFTIHQAVEDEEDDLEDIHNVQTLCVNLCQFLARSTDGVYQVDGQGFFAADGRLLVSEHQV